MFISQKYLKNFKKHRNIIFLAQKIFFHKVNNENEIYEILKLKKRNYSKKIKFPLNDSLNSNDFISEKVFNFDKLVNYLNIIRLTNRINYNLFIDFLLKFFKYSYLIRFFVESSIILFFLIYFFKTGTFY